jgi:hypothetical protein
MSNDNTIRNIVYERQTQTQTQTHPQIHDNGFH